MEACNINKPYVFISYKREDKETVMKVVEELQSKYRVNIWIDTELASKGGTTWNSEATAAIARKTCKCVLFFMSDLSMMSGPVLAELYFSQNSNKVKWNNENNPLKIIPICLSQDLKNYGLTKWVYKILPNHEIAGEEIKEADIIAWKEVDLPGRYLEGANRITEISEIGAVISELIFKNKDTITHIEAEADAIFNNIREYAGVCIEPEQPAESREDNTVETVMTVEKKAEELLKEEPPKEEPQKIKAHTTVNVKNDGSVFHIKGKNGTYDAFYRKSEGTYTVLRGSKIRYSETYTPKKIWEQYKDRITEEGYLLCDIGNLTVSTAAKLIEGMSTNGKELDSSDKLMGENESYTVSLGSSNTVGETGAIKIPDKKKSECTNGYRYYIYDVEYHIQNGQQANLLYDTFKVLTEKYPEKVSDMAEKCTCVKRMEDVLFIGTPESDPGYFRMFRKFTISGVDYVVGGSYGLEQKIAQIYLMLDICNEDRAVFRLEGYEKKKKDAVNRSGKKGIGELLDE